MMSLTSHDEMLLCADACPEVAPVAGRDPAIMRDGRVLEQLLRLEHYSVPERDYFASAPSCELQPYMRRVVTTWMLEVCEEQNCEEQVFPLAVNLLDRFLALEAHVLQRCQLQLLGCVCLLTASKLRQCRPIGVDLLVYYTDYSVTAAQIRAWEMLLLGKLGWDVSGVTAFDFVDHLMERLALTSSNNNNNNNNDSDTTASLLRGHALTHVSLCCTETEYMRVRPSMIAAASVASAMNRLGLTMVVAAETSDNGGGVFKSSSASTSEILLAALVAADADQLASLVRSVETLMAAQLASVQQQQQQQQQQEHHIQQQQQHQHLKSSKLQQTTTTTTTTTTANWELDVQPETPTDIQDVHF